MLLEAVYGLSERMPDVADAVHWLRLVYKFDHLLGIQTVVQVEHCLHILPAAKALNISIN